MSTTTNVFAVYASATGTAYAGAQNLCGYHIKPGGTAGSVIVRDGGSGGTIRMQVDVTTALEPVALQLPGNGIRFTTDLHVTVPTGTTATLFLG